MRSHAHVYLEATRILASLVTPMLWSEVLESPPGYDSTYLINLKAIVLCQLNMIAIEIK